MDPKFQRWTGDGTVAIQIQHGMSVAELFRAEDNRLRLIAPAEGEFSELQPQVTDRNGHDL